MNRIVHNLRRLIKDKEKPCSTINNATKYDFQNNYNFCCRFSQNVSLFTEKCGIDKK